MKLKADAHMLLKEKVTEIIDKHFKDTDNDDLELSELRSKLPAETAATDETLRLFQPGPNHALHHTLCMRHTTYQCSRISRPGSKLVKLLAKSGKPYDYTLDEKTGLVAEIGYKA